MSQSADGWIETAKELPDHNTFLVAWCAVDSSIVVQAVWWMKVPDGIEHARRMCSAMARSS